jgi:ATP-dependent Lon protease
MKESAQAAMSWTRANSARLGIDHDKIMSTDLHIHLPQGAIKKDGPSAGVALACVPSCRRSAAALRNDVAITGEVDLRGNAMPVGGIKEKVLAAHRAGCKVVFLPERNRKDVEEIPADVRSELDIRFMTKVDDALKVVLAPAPAAADPAPAMPPPSAPPTRSSGDQLPS